MGLPLTINRAIERIENDPSYKVFSAGRFATANVEAILSRTDNPSFFNEIQIESIASIIRSFNASKNVDLFLKWPNSSYLGIIPSDNRYYWEDVEYLEAQNKRDQVLSDIEPFLNEWKNFYNDVKESFPDDLLPEPPRIVIGLLEEYYDKYKRLYPAIEMNPSLLYIVKMGDLRPVVLGTENFLGY